MEIGDYQIKKWLQHLNSPGRVIGLNLVLEDIVLIMEDLFLQNLLNGFLKPNNNTRCYLN